ncbi:hypothetical protein OROMI_016033 [Orobanche minor]
MLFDPRGIPISGDQSPYIYFLPSRLKLNLRRYCILNLYHQVPPVSALRLTPGRHLQVKDVRTLVKEKFNAAPELHGFIRSRGLVRGFAIEELPFEVDEGQQFVDREEPFSGGINSSMESIGLPEDPLKLVQLL